MTHAADWSTLQVLMDSGIFQHAALPPRDREKHKWLIEELACVPLVIEVARSGLLVLCIAGETSMEQWGAPRAALPHSPLNPFVGIPLEKVPPPYHYGRVVASYDWKKHESVEQWRAFLRSITDPEYLRVLGLLGGNKLEDAFLVVTARRAGIPMVLTTDGLFYRAARSLRNKAYPVEVLSPRALAKALGTTRRARPTPRPRKGP